MGDPFKNEEAQTDPSLRPPSLESRQSFTFADAQADPSLRPPSLESRQSFTFADAQADPSLRPPSLESRQSFNFEEAQGVPPEFSTLTYSPQETPRSGLERAARDYWSFQPTALLPKRPTQGSAPGGIGEPLLPLDQLARTHPELFGVVGLASKYLPEGQAKNIARGITAGVGDVAAGLTSPANLTLMAASAGLGALPKAVQVGAQLGFAIQMALQVPGQTKEAVAAIKAGDTEAAARAIAAGVINGIFTEEAGRGAIHGLKGMAKAQPSLTSPIGLETQPTGAIEPHAIPERSPATLPVGATPEDRGSVVAREIQRHGQEGIQTQEQGVAQTQAGQETARPVSNQPIPVGAPAPAAPVTWRGWQSGMGVTADIPLWNLTEDIPGHPKGSTLKSQTLVQAGYHVPEPPVPRPATSLAPADIQDIRPAVRTMSGELIPAEKGGAHGDVAQTLPATEIDRRTYEDVATGREVTPEQLAATGLPTAGQLGKTDRVNRVHSDTLTAAQKGAVIGAPGEAKSLEKEAEFRTFVSQPSTLKTGINAGELAPGDQFSVANQEFQVARVDAKSGEVVLQDGPRFGTQIISNDETIQVRNYRPIRAANLEVPGRVQPGISPRGMGPLEGGPPEPKGGVESGSELRQLKSGDVLRPGPLHQQLIVDRWEPESSLPSGWLHLRDGQGHNLGALRISDGQTTVKSMQWELVAAMHDSQPPTPPFPTPGDQAKLPAGPSGIKDAALERERAQMGLAPIMPVARQHVGEWWDQASRQMEADPSWVPNLITSLEDHFRPLDRLEAAGLLRSKIELRHQRDVTLRGMREALDHGDPSLVQELKMKDAALADRLDHLNMVAERTMAEWGRTGVMSQRMANDDFSLVSMVLEKEGGLGRRLTPEESAEVGRLQADIAAKDKTFAEYQATAQERISQLEAGHRLDQIAHEKPPVSQRVLDVAEKWVKQWEVEAQAARQALAGKFLSPTPEDLLNLAKIARADIGRLGLDFSEWSSRMVGEWGGKVRPHLQGAWDMAQKMIDGMGERGAPGKVVRAARQHVKQGAPTIEQMRDRIAERVDRGETTRITPLVQKLARIFVGQGIRDRDALVDAVHGVLHEIVPQMTRRQAMDAISGYGDFREMSKDQVSVTLRDLKGQLQQVAKLEDLQGRAPPRKSGIERRVPSDEERTLIKLVNEAKRRFGIVVTDPATQLKSALDARKTYWRNRLTDLQTQIDQREKFIKTQTPSPTDPELDSLKEQAGALKVVFDRTFPTLPKTNAELLAELKQRLVERRELYERRLAAGDFAAAPRQSVSLDPEALRLETAAERAKQNWRSARAQDRLLQRPWYEQGADKLVKWRQAFVISGVRSLVKLASATIEGVVLLPAREVAGGVIGKLPGIRTIAERAPGEGGYSLPAEVTAIAETYRHLIDDFVANVKGHKPDFETVYGPWRNLPSELQNYVGFLHGALKSPLARNTWTRSFNKRLEFAARHGVDVTDPLVHMELGRQAWEDSSFWRFQTPNLATSIYRQILGRLGAPAKPGETAGVRRGFGFLTRIELPVVTVPTNIVARMFEANFGLLLGSGRAALALRRGVETLSPQQADLIMRNLKTGLLGGALWLTGYFARHQIGGFYQPGQRPKEGEVHWGGMRVAGTEIPAYLLHNPFLIQIQWGATFGKIMDSLRDHGRTLPESALLAAWESSLGAAQEQPFVRAAMELPKAATGHTTEQFLGEHLRNYTVPMAVQWVAEISDQAAKRKPRTVAEEFKMGIPGLRQQVPQAATEWRPIPGQ